MIDTFLKDVKEWLHHIPYLISKGKKDRDFFKFYIYKRFKKFKRYEKINDVKFLNFIIDVPDFLSFFYQYWDIFLDEEFKFNCETEVPIIYDCGANIGMSILYFKQLYPKAKIKAFEADPYITEILKSNLLKNKITDVEIINKAVWINNNGVEFGIEGADAGSIYYPGKKIKVESIRLKDWIEKEEKIDFLKIDIEGAEYEVILDCKDVLNKVKNIFFEWHSFDYMPQKLGQILIVLESNKFRYYIQNITKRKHPFINRQGYLNMDFQANIWAYRNP